MSNDRLMYPVCQNWEFGQGYGTGRASPHHWLHTYSYESIDGDGYGFGYLHGWHTGWGFGGGIHQIVDHQLGGGHGYGFEYYQLNKFTIWRQA